MKQETKNTIALVLVPIFALIGLLISLMTFKYFNINSGPILGLGFGVTGVCAFIPLMFYKESCNHR
ncbi:MAG: hypothetical protein IMZ52_10210 [Actinobacteria bacterium]|nr:hypothetical protein [Actinomycetota bacterium]MBE3122562.1 hypothetical protein [Thermoplasmata archaeon]